MFPKYLYPAENNPSYTAERGHRLRFGIYRVHAVSSTSISTALRHRRCNNIRMCQIVYNTHDKGKIHFCFAKYYFSSALLRPRGKISIKSASLSTSSTFSSFHSFCSSCLTPCSGTTCLHAYGFIPQTAVKPCIFRPPLPPRPRHHGTLEQARRFGNMEAVRRLFKVCTHNDVLRLLQTQ